MVIRRAISTIVEKPRDRLLPPRRTTRAAGRPALFALRAHMRSIDHTISGHPPSSTLDVDDRNKSLRPRIITRGALKRLGVGCILLAGLALWGWWTMIRMPGQSYRGRTPQAGYLMR